mgnify:CR=1 FL=1
MFRWGLLVSLRDGVNKALENARAAGVFKKAQDTELTISVAEEKDAEFLRSANLAALCIVSKVTVTTDSIEGEQVEDCLIPCTIAVKVSEAPSALAAGTMTSTSAPRPPRRAVRPVRSRAGSVTRCQMIRSKRACPPSVMAQFLSQ